MPLFVVEGHWEAAQAVHAHPAFFADAEFQASRCGVDSFPVPPGGLLILHKSVRPLDCLDSMIGIAMEFVEGYPINAFMQNALPPDFSNSEVSIDDRVQPSLARICGRFGVQPGG